MDIGVVLRSAEARICEIEYYVGIQADKAVAAQPFACKPKGVDVVGKGKRRVLDKVNLRSKPTRPASDMLNDLVPLVSNHDRDLANARHV